MMIFTSILLLILVVTFAPTTAIPTIEAIGPKFFTSEGKQWFVKGIAYQLIEDDPLVNVEQCKLDAALMKQLGANAIRVYHVDAAADHSGCMKAFADNGIYLFADMDSFKTYIRYDTTPSWTQNKSDSYRAVMDNFAQYDNTAGFFVGNEVLNSLVDSGSAPYLLAAAVDLKAYRDSKGYRKIPIGYSATDTDALPMLQDYLVCRPNETERLEFYALNSYRWCGSQATYQTSGYVQLQAAAEGYPIPIWLSETGCNTVPPRGFQDQSAVFGSNMSSTWSGAIVYEWIQELNNYGLISYGPQQAADVQVGSSIVQGFTRQGTPTPIMPDFANLQSQWATLTPTGIARADATMVSTRSRSCPAYTAGGWSVDASAPLPTLGQVGSAGSSSSAMGSKSMPVSSGSRTATASTSGATANAGAGLHTAEFGVIGLSACLALVVGIIMFML